MGHSVWWPVTLSFVALAGLLSSTGPRQTSRTQIMSAIAGEKPAAVLEVAFDGIVTH
jgi:hypothetical protein